MCNVAAIIFLAVIMLANTKERVVHHMSNTQDVIDKLVDNFIDRFFSWSLKARFLHCEDLDSTALSAAGFDFLSWARSPERISPHDTPPPREDVHNSHSGPLFIPTHPSPEPTLPPMPPSSQDVQRQAAMDSESEEAAPELPNQLLSPEPPVTKPGSEMEMEVTPSEEPGKQYAARRLSLEPEQFLQLSSPSGSTWGESPRSVKTVSFTDQTQEPKSPQTAAQSVANSPRSVKTVSFTDQIQEPKSPQTVARSVANSGSPKICSICWSPISKEKLQISEPFKTLCCRQLFHTDCMQKHKDQQSSPSNPRACPLCRSLMPTGMTPMAPQQTLDSILPIHRRHIMPDSTPQMQRMGERDAISRARAAALIPGSASIRLLGTPASAQQFRPSPVGWLNDTLRSARPPVSQLFSETRFASSPTMVPLDDPMAVDTPR